MIYRANTGGSGENGKQAFRLMMNYLTAGDKPGQVDTLDAGQSKALGFDTPPPWAVAAPATHPQAESELLGFRSRGQPGNNAGSSAAGAAVGAAAGQAMASSGW